MHRYGLTADTRDTSASLTQSKLSVVEHFIHEHVADHIQIEDLAALLHMSPSHFARAFKHATGHPPHFYLTTERLRLAQSMLSEGSLPLIQIAALVGVAPLNRDSGTNRRHEQKCVAMTSAFTVASSLFVRHFAVRSLRGCRTQDVARLVVR